MAGKNESLTLPEFTQSFEKIKPYLVLPETEEAWERILNALEKLEGLCRSGACEHPGELIPSIRSVQRNITSAMNSERTRLSGTAVDVLSSLALGLNAHFEPLISFFVPPLILLCGRANKVVVSRAKACILAIIGATQLPGILPYLVQFVKEKSPTIRLMVAEGTLCCLKCFNPPDLEKEIHVREVESIIRHTVQDASADVRKVGRNIFQSYKVLLPHRVESFASPLTPTVRKYLQLGTGTVQAGDRATALIHTKVNPTSKSASHVTAPKSIPTTGPIRPSKTTTISKPGNIMRTQVPLRSIQVPAKRGESHLSGVSYQRKLPGAIIRSVAPSAAISAGPQRVIKPSVRSTEGPSSLSHDKSDAKPRLDKPRSGTDPVSKRANLTRQLSSTGRHPVKYNPVLDAARTTSGSRDLTRPTLSQLARVKPPIAKAPSKPVLGLKTNPPVKLELTKPTRILTERVATTSIRRPITPTSIPLPSSPKSSPTEPTSGVEDTNPTDEKDAGVTEFGEAEVRGDEPPLPQSVENSVSTPMATSNHIPSVGVACKTPISALLSSIQHGFDLTPCSPLSPPEHYTSSPDSLHRHTQFRLGFTTQQDVYAVTQP